MQPFGSVYLREYHSGDSTETRLALEVESEINIPITTDTKDSIPLTFTCEVLCIQTWKLKRQEEIRNAVKIKTVIRSRYKPENARTKNGGATTQCRRLAGQTS